jgi:hypothetical protein
MFIHIKFCENQSTGSEAERETYRGHGELVSILSTLRNEGRLIKNGKILRKKIRGKTDYFMTAVMDC